MKELHIADAILTRRREKGVTQEELAAYIGVSKASVSKWETGQSYPDITFLPQLAAYFNISIDELVGYEPQMTTQDIRKLYKKLCMEFASEPFDQVVLKCRDIIKKYYSCFPLLLQMAMLLINYGITMAEENRQEELVKECRALFIRIKEESGDVELCRQAIHMEALCQILLREPEPVLGLLENSTVPMLSPEPLLANAYLLLGKPEKAKETMQICFYQHLVSLIDGASVFCSLYLDEPDKFEEIVQRTLGLCDLYQIERLHPTILLSAVLTAAQCYCTLGNTEQAIGLLKRYCSIVQELPAKLELHGDKFFDLLGNWFETFELGTLIPRDEKTVRKNITDCVAQNPAFDPLKQDPRFQSILDKLGAAGK